jgi:site-specific DNA recombinase
MNRKAALYARVSTLQQEQEATIESQVAALEAYAQAQDLQLEPPHYFLDQAVSGAQLDRPALNRLRDLAAEGGFEVVLCLSPDRLARQFAHQWVLLDELHKAGVEVRFVNQVLPADNPQGQLLLGIQGLFAEYERTMITERLRRGKLYKVRQGRLVNPVPPYGYTYIPVSQPNGGRWEVQPVEAETVRQIYQWYTGEELTIHQIVDRLHQSGGLAPARGNRWTYSTVQAILKQKAYTGQAYYNCTRKCQETVGQPRKIGRGYRREAARQLRPVEEWLSITVPSILSEDEWQRAQERLQMNQKFASRNNKHHFYLLRGLLVCQECGRTLIGSLAGGQVRYQCSNRGKGRSPEIAPHSISVSGSVIEPLVWQELTRLLRNPRLLADAWQSQDQPIEQDDQELQRLKKRLKSLERQWVQVLDAYQSELLSKEDLADRKQALDHDRQAVEERLTVLQRQVRRGQEKEQMLQDFETYCQQIQASLEAPSLELQQEIIRLLIDHVVVGKEEILIKHIVPTDDDSRLLPGRR